MFCELSIRTSARCRGGVGIAGRSVIISRSGTAVGNGIGTTRLNTAYLLQKHCIAVLWLRVFFSTPWYCVSEPLPAIEVANVLQTREGFLCAITATYLALGWCLFSEFYCIKKALESSNLVFLIEEVVDISFAEVKQEETHYLQRCVHICPECRRNGTAFNDQQH